jgi:hypothetical protein
MGTLTTPRELFRYRWPYTTFHISLDIMHLMVNQLNHIILDFSMVSVLLWNRLI